MRVVIPMNERLRKLPNQNFCTLAEALVHAGPDFGMRIECIDEKHIRDCGKFDVLFSIRTVGLRSPAMFAYYRDRGVRIVMWHDDVISQRYRIPISVVRRNSYMVRCFNDADLIYLPYVTQAMRFRYYRANYHKIVRMPWSVPDRYFAKARRPWEERSGNALLSGRLSWQYGLRTRIHRYCAADSSLPVDVLDHSGYDVECLKHAITGQAYIDRLAQHRCALATTGYGYTLAKYMEIPAAGCMLMCEPTLDLELLGFRDGQNCRFITRSNFRQILKDLAGIVDPAIAAAGYELVRKRHVHSVRVDEMLRIMRDRVENGWQ